MVVLRRKNFGIASKILGVINPSWWLSKEADKLAYENDPKKYKKKRFLSFFRSYFPDVARKRLDTALRMKKSGATPEEIRNEINSKKFDRAEWKNVGKDILTFGLYDAYHSTKNMFRGLSYRKDPYRAKIS